MIPATQMDNQWILLQRIAQGQFSCKICKRLCLLSIGLIILTFGIAVVIFHENYTTFCIATAMIDFGILLFTIAGMTIFYDVCREAFELSTLQLKERRISQSQVEALATEAPIASTSL